MRVACVFVCALGAVACDNDSTVVIDTTGENFCSQIADVACHNWYQCCTESEIEDNLSVSEPRTELECREDMRLRCERAAVTLRDSLIDGRITFDAMRLNQCLGAIIAPEAVCSEVVEKVPWEDACMESAFVGTIAIGGDCRFTHDCQGNPDNFCAPSQKCTAKPITGQPCGTGCASAYYCSGSICQPRLGAGAMCTTSPPNQCADDLYCDINALPLPVCAARQPGGGPCSSPLGCESGQCIPGQCAGTTQTCYRDSGPPGVGCYGRCGDDGLFCTVSSDCMLGTCTTGGSCTETTICPSGGTCLFTVTCLPGDCIGDPVCTNATLAVDYCDGTASIPVI